MGVKGSERDIYQGTIPTFAWRDWGKSRSIRIRHLQNKVRSVRGPSSSLVVFIQKIVLFLLFIVLFNAAISSLECTMRLGSMWKWPWLNSRYFPDIWLEGPRGPIETSGYLASRPSFELGTCRIQFRDDNASEFIARVLILNLDRGTG
jgi:hypothetical protein